MSTKAAHSFGAPCCSRGQLRFQLSFWVCHAPACGEPIEAPLYSQWNPHNLDAHLTIQRLLSLWGWENFTTPHTQPCQVHAYPSSVSHKFWWILKVHRNIMLLDTMPQRCITSAKGSILQYVVAKFTSLTPIRCIWPYLYPQTAKILK